MMIVFFFISWAFAIFSAFMAGKSEQRIRICKALGDEMQQIQRISVSPNISIEKRYILVGRLEASSKFLEILEKEARRDPMFKLVEKIHSKFQSKKALKPKPENHS